MESLYSYSEEQQGGYYVKCYSPDQGGSYYDPDCSDFSNDAQDHYANDNFETCAAIGSKHTPETLPSLPEINPKGNCHAVQLRSGTTYQPPQAADLGKGRKEKEKEPTDFTPAADQSQRPAAPLRSVPPEIPQPAEPDSYTDAEMAPAAAAPLRSGPLPENQPPDPHFPSTTTIPKEQKAHKSVASSKWSQIVWGKWKSHTTKLKTL
ncbi:hypothetical protein SASPL_120467 [Salvia splendens]|uniref:Uncharacterized protein n=1 Tax=Salvia splendens TaxID=180675 RepID=A0A8X8XQ75_SALSN|nr:hypothetical protein SASPL_120467 [Salvia splendens]